MEEKKYACGVFLDQKAFDTANHKSFNLNLNIMEFETKRFSGLKLTLRIENNMFISMELTLQPLIYHVVSQKGLF